MHSVFEFLHLCNGDDNVDPACLRRVQQYLNGKMDPQGCVNG